ncbi:hypothetical protein, partial [Brucella intermedia]|uniref:hypothetical protein n=1 Tax=Brucella intermedia TaxID=94625 RepID=UPI0023622D1F
MTRFAASPAEAAIARIEQSGSWTDRLDAMQPLINRIYADPARARIAVQPRRRTDGFNDHRFISSPAPAQQAPDRVACS